MIVRRFEPKDFEALKNWGSQWGANYEEHQFPKTGFIVDGIAAFFLYSSDSSVCWLENLVANKSADKTQKKEALNLLITAAFAEAKRLGFKVAYAASDLMVMAQHANNHGAKVKPFHFLITKDLTQL